MLINHHYLQNLIRLLNRYCDPLSSLCIIQEIRVNSVNYYKKKIPVLQLNKHLLNPMDFGEIQLGCSQFQFHFEELGKGNRLP